MTDYNLSDMRKILEDLENALAINCIILLTKRVIYNSMKKERPPHFINFKYEVNFFYQEKYRQYIKGKNNEFDKQYNLLCTYYDNVYIYHCNAMQYCDNIIQ